MLTPEQARKLIETHKIDGMRVQKLQMDAIKQLAKDLRPSAYALIQRDEKGKRIEYYGPKRDPDAEKQQAQALQYLNVMEAAHRQKILDLFFPKIGRYVTMTWEFMEGLPYQSGYARKAFRAPNNPQAYFLKRIHWLRILIQRITSYDEDLIWLAQYTPYIGHGYAGNTLGVLFAAVIDSDDPIGDEIFDVLVASAKEEHEIGTMGRHVSRALLSASRPDGWEFMERMLLAAQREEGLRQTILETVDEAHPDAYKRMLRLIHENDLARFSAVTRAANVWFGFLEDSDNKRGITQMLATVLEMLEDPGTVQQTLEQGDGYAVYLALWATAFEDAFKAIPLASDLLIDNQLERRFAGLHMLATLDLPESHEAMVATLDDEDLRLVAYTCQYFRQGRIPEHPDLFEKIEAALQRLPDKARVLEPVLWEWLPVRADKRAAAGRLLNCLGDRSPKRLILHMTTFEQYDRVNAGKIIAKLGMSDPEVRDVVLKLVGDRSGWVRKAGVEIMSEQYITSDDAPYLEGLLTRKANDLRRGVLELLVKQKDDHALASADRLLAAKKPLQRAAGLELLQLLVDASREENACRERAKAYRAAHPDADEIEKTQLDHILEEAQVELTLENVLGLIDPADLTEGLPKKRHDITLLTPAAVGCLIALDELIHEHRNAPLMLNTWQGEQEMLLGNVAPYAFPQPDPAQTIEEDNQRLPLSEVWLQWYESRPKELRDSDGLELLRAWLDLTPNGYRTAVPETDGGDGSLVERLKNIVTDTVNALMEKEPRRVEMRYGMLVGRLIEWLLRLDPPDKGADFLLDAIDVTYSSAPPDLRQDLWVQRVSYWSQYHNSVHYLQRHLLRQYAATVEKLTDEQYGRLFQILKRWKLRPLLLELLAAYRAGMSSKTDLYDQLLGKRPQRQGYYHASYDFGDLSQLSSKKLHALLAEYPVLQEVFEACRQRILEIELKRGEMPTPASAPAMALRSVIGVDWFVQIVQVLGKDTLTRGYAYNSQSRATVLSHLLRVTFPAEDDTPEQFAKMVKDAKLTEKRLVEAAVYAPQWAQFVEHALGWDGFTSAVWWIHAHTKDTNWYVDVHIRETWQAEVNERTPLTGEDLLAGAVDVQWFQQFHQILGDERWDTLYRAAKYSSGGRGHTRAKLFADAMLNNVPQADVIKRISEKRHQDSVRALGLLPLPKKSPDDEIQSRYQIMQEFVRTSRKFGSQRQASEKLAARIGLENLARTAGYPDPLRLEWAVEAQEVADLRDGPVSATVENVTVALRIDMVGKPQLEIRKDGKKLKSIPAKMRKVEVFSNLRERKNAISKQHSRMRLALETAMCREDGFTVGELRELTRHPVLAPMLEQLVFMTGDIMGYPVEEGAGLQVYDGHVEPLLNDPTLRIAHPYDLYQTGEWSQWQRECFLAERIQPFKQVFRELYVLTDAERLDGAISRRYAGHQLQPRQALALFSSRRWVTRPEEGVQRTFHKHKLAAFVTFLQGFYTPAEVEGLTIEGVVFVEPGKWWQPLQLAGIPPILFAEVMRDMDLVVSVAHRGGVDPEATASTVEMRSALIRETCGLLSVDNVELQSNHALIEGKLGSYSVHLGSAIVHRQPGGALCMIPVHAQHRGRIFLPFADDDPKTAEVISKVLLLARDDQIKDPTILEQIYAGG